MSNFELPEKDKERLRKMNLFEGYQCGRDPALWRFKNGLCISTLGIEVSNCLECSNWKSKNDDLDGEEE